MHGNVFEFKSWNNSSKTHEKKIKLNYKLCNEANVRRIVNRYYFLVA